jgi:hypothetical protein
MDWERMVLGPRGRGLGRSRWPLATAICLVAGGYSGYLGDWQLAALLFGAAVFFGLITLWRFR